MFLSTKLFTPLTPPGMALRERLTAELDAGWASQARLFLLSAPPGYGKTTLLSSWVQARGIPCAWVSLDPEDNDPARFFLMLVKALEKFIPGLGELEKMVSLPQVTRLDSLAVEMINRAAADAHSLLLVIDDYHAIHNPAIHDLIQTLATYLPPAMRLAVLTREDPPLSGLARMRARRQLVELRARALAFTPGEARGLLVDTLHLPLDEAQVNALVERTEGWAAGLHLAALVLRDEDQPDEQIAAFSGSNRFVLDYLAAEVLDGLDPELRQFLCATAVLDRFTAELCDFALQRSGSRELLDRAAAANLFLIPLDEKRTWYRYHHLMADILQAELRPDEKQAVRRQAARWWLASGQAVEAVRYAQAAQDDEIACEAIRAAAIPTAESGMIATVLGWLDTLPEEILLAHADLCVLRAWFMLFHGRFRELPDWIERIQSQPASLPRPLAGLLMAIEGWLPTLAARRMDPDRLQEAYNMTGGNYPYFGPMILMAMGQAQRENWDFAGALRSFEQGAELAEAASSTVSALILRNNQIFLLNTTGQRQAAGQMARDAVDLHSPGGKPGLLAGIPLLPYGVILYESGRLEEAYTALSQGINLVRRLGLYDILTAPAINTLLHLLIDQQRIGEARALVKEARRQAANAGIHLIVRERDVIATWIELADGDSGPMLRWVENHPLDPEMITHPAQFTSVLTTARANSLTGRQAEAVALLETLRAHLALAGPNTYWVRASAELAQVHQSAGQTQAALAVLAEAVEAAAKMEFWQVFRRHVSGLAGLLERLRPQQPQAVAAILVQPAAQAPAAEPALIEPLSERELEILRLVAAGLSNADIASRLYLTTGTVKWYLNRLFGKLNASRRTEAVAQAKAMGLI